MVFSVAVAPVLAEGSINDVNLPARARIIHKGVVTPACLVETQFSGMNSQMGRVFRDAIPSVCPSKAYPGIFNPGTPYFFETYNYPNTSGSLQCVTVNFDPNPAGDLATDCDTNAHASAYLNTYDPANQSANFVGDVGSSITDSFSFNVPAANALVLVVTNTSAEEICDFNFEVVNLECTGDADLELAKSVAPNSALPGENALFTVTVTNNGPISATNTVVTDTLPAGVTYVSNDCGASFADPVVTWNVGTVMPSTSALCNITVTVDESGALVNNATVTSDTSDPVSANNSATATLQGRSPEPVPTLSETGMFLMLLGLGAAAMWRLRRRGARA